MKKWVFNLISVILGLFSFLAGYILAYGLPRETLNLAFAALAGFIALFIPLFSYLLFNLCGHIAGEIKKKRKEKKEENSE